MKITKQRIRDVVREELESLTEGGNIDPKKLSEEEIQFVIGAINFFGAGEGAPLADVKTIKYFKTQYLFKLFAKNKGRMTSDGREYYQSIVKKLKT